jgi:hypothetical protein
MRARIDHWHRLDSSIPLDLCLPRNLSSRSPDMYPHGTLNAPYPTATHSHSHTHTLSLTESATMNKAALGLWTRWLCCSDSAGERNPQPIAVTYDPSTMHPGIELQFPSQRFPGSPGSPVGRTPAPSSHPGRETFRGAGRPQPPPTAPPASPSEWDWDVTSPTEGTAGANFPPGSIATRNQALVMQEMYADEDYMERVRSTRLATRQTV